MVLWPYGWKQSIKNVEKDDFSFIRIDNLLIKNLDRVLRRNPGERMEQENNTTKNVFKKLFFHKNVILTWPTPISPTTN